jgi:hypothetical protein
MLDLQFGKDFKIMSDDRNFIVVKRQKNSKGGVDNWKNIAYYPFFSMAADDIIEMNMMHLDATTLKQVISYLDELKNAIKGLQEAKTVLKKDLKKVK